MSSSDIDIKNANGTSDIFTGTEITLPIIASGLFGIATIGSTGYAAFNNRKYAYIIVTCIVLLIVFYFQLTSEDDLMGVIGSSIYILIFLFILGLIMTGSWFITLPLLLSRKSTSE